MGTRPVAPDAMQQQITVIYFLGTSPGRYQPIISDIHRGLAS
jgi:hypothetical protein